MVVVAETDTQFEGHGPLLDASDKEVHILLDDIVGEFHWIGVIHNHRTGIAHGGQLFVVLTVSCLGTHKDHIHPESPQDADQAEGLEGAAHIDGSFHTRQLLFALLHGGKVFGNLFTDNFRSPLLHKGVLFAEVLGHFVEGLGNILHTEVGDPFIGYAVLVFQLLRQGGKGAGTLHKVQRGSVGTADIIDSAVSGQDGDYFDAHTAVVLLDNPGLSGKVELPEDIDAQGADFTAVVCAHDFTQGGTGGLVAVFFGAGKTG